MKFLRPLLLLLLAASISGIETAQAQDLSGITVAVQPAFPSLSKDTWFGFLGCAVATMGLKHFYEGTKSLAGSFDQEDAAKRSDLRKKSTTFYTISSVELITGIATTYYFWKS